MTQPTNDRLFCQEQAARSNRLFLVSQVYADAGSRQALVSLYALFSVIEQVCSGSREENVGLTRLGWWQHELRSGPGSSSSHPVVKELRRTGVAERISSTHTDQLLLSAHSRLEAPLITDMADLRQLCLDTGRPPIDMEFALFGQETNESHKEGLAWRSGLAQLIRESSAGAGPGGWWWIPLNLLARHGLTRADVDDPAARERAKALFLEILDFDGWDRPDSGGLLDDISGEIGELRHAFVLDALYTRKFRVFKNAGPAGLGTSLLQTGPTDVFSAWRAARAFSRRR